MDTLRVLACGLILSISALFSFPALALEVNQCGTVAALTESLKAEGQHSLVSALRLTYPRERITKDPTLRGILITANDNGTQGYIVQTNKPLGKGPTQACIYNRMANIRFYDATKPGVVPAVLSKGNEAAANKRCATLEKKDEEEEGTCFFLNSWLQKTNKQRERTIVQADNLSRQKDGSYKPDAVTVTITGDVSYIGDVLHDGAGSIVYTTSDGAGVLQAILNEAQYTPDGEDRLGWPKIK